MNPNEIYEVFRQHKDIFPHIRFDYIHKQYFSGNIFIIHGVIIIIHIYKIKTKLGNKKGDTAIKQMLNLSPGNGKAERALCELLRIFKADIYLTVRNSNMRAIAFYKKVGFEIKSFIAWKNETIPGYLMKREYNGR